MWWREKKLWNANDIEKKKHRKKNYSLILLFDAIEKNTFTSRIAKRANESSAVRLGSIACSLILPPTFKDCRGRGVSIYKITSSWLLSFYFNFLFGCSSHTHTLAHNIRSNKWCCCFFSFFPAEKANSPFFYAKPLRRSNVSVVWSLVSRLHARMCAMPFKITVINVFIAFFFFSSHK